MHNFQTHRASLVAAALAMAAAAQAEGLVPAGFYEVYQNGQLVEIAPNLIPAEMRSYLLRAGYAGGAQITDWYVGAFSNAVDPADNLTGNTWRASLAEFVNYSEATRPLWAQDVEANQAIANATTLAKITIGAGGGTLNGIVLTSNSAKGTNGGTLGAATRFAAPRPVQEGDTLEFKYTMQLNLPA